MFTQQIINGLTIGSVYALIALGYTMVYGILRIVNFAHGDIFMMGTFFGLLLVKKLWSAFPLAFTFAVIFTARGCWWKGWLIVRYGFPSIIVLISALGVSSFWQFLPSYLGNRNPSFFFGYQLFFMN